MHKCVRVDDVFAPPPRRMCSLEYVSTKLSYLFTKTSSFHIHHGMASTEHRVSEALATSQCVPISQFPDIADAITLGNGIHEPWPYVL